MKYGPLITENEGHALLFIEKKLNTTAPHLYAIYRDQKDPHTLYIVMEYIRGISLGMAWLSLTETNKDSIAAQLRCIFDQMRALPSPEFFFYGSVNGGPVPHRYFYSRENDPAIIGPFQTEEEFGRAIALRSKKTWSESNIRSFLSDYLGRHLLLFVVIRLCLLINISIERMFLLGRSPTLVDWETAGWYPSYWEYAHIFPLLQWVGDWPEYDMWRIFLILCRWRVL